LGVNTIYTQGINPFAANDTITFNNAFVDYPAHTSNAGKDLIFTITYPHQSMKDITNLTVTACKLVVRIPTGYLAVNGTATDANGYDFMADSNATITATKADRYTFYVRITMNSKFTNLPNNNCNVAVTCAGLTVKFT
jgi:predicted flavoprotein YhiN